MLTVPPGYDPGVPTPLLVQLHGGVGVADVFDDPVATARENELGALAMENGWIALFPFGQAGATWWDEVGMANIESLIRVAKRELNVDDAFAFDVYDATVKVDFNILSFRHYNHRSRRCMKSTACFCCWDSLNSMNTAFKFHITIYIIS